MPTRVSSVASRRRRLSPPVSTRSGSLRPSGSSLELVIHMNGDQVARLAASMSTTGEPLRLLDQVAPDDQL
jgi:hypothetical protein